MTVKATGGMVSGFGALESDLGGLAWELAGGGAICTVTA